MTAQNSLWNSAIAQQQRQKSHNGQLRIFPTGKITFGSDPFLRNEKRGENCTLSNFRQQLKNIDTEYQIFSLINTKEECEKCISKNICPKNFAKTAEQTSLALCAMRKAFLMEERLENA